MDEQVQHLLSEVAQYIEYTQPRLEKAAALGSSMQSYQLKVAEAIDKLVEKGLVPLQEKVAVYNNLANRPEKAAELLCKLSEQIDLDRPSLGGPSDRFNVDAVDPIIGFCLGDSY